MDVQSISQVNKRFVFLADSTREKATPELLRVIYRMAKIDAAFYERMYEEVSQIIDREREKLQTRHCPTLEEINVLHSAAAEIEMKIQREYYLRDADRISGLYIVLSDATQKRRHCEKIERQTCAALGE